MSRWFAGLPLVLVLALLSAGPASFPARADDNGYVAGVEDLPLMPGLTEDVQSSMIFRSAAGRIVEAYAAGRIRAQYVTAFYSETLPQLGWSPIDSEHYSRDGELLEIEVLPEVTDPSRVSVRFSLSPGKR